MPLPDFDPLVAEWFEQRFQGATEPQRLGWPEIRSGRDVLISAPTGSGKTLAAFLICLDDLIRSARAGSLSDETVAVYVSPLKALSNDIHKNLEAPLAELYELAANKGLELPRIRTAVRSGDTPAWERQQMLRKPPHILVTTPESLFILLTAEKSRVMLSTARTVIVDEIHAVADDKRGSHLALSLARLERLTCPDAGSNGRPKRLQRIGLSATVKPIEQVARFLSATFAPNSTTHAASGRIIQVGHRREMELAVEVPKDELGPIASNEMWEEIYDRLAELIRSHQTTLVFVNTRRLAERVTHHLQQRLGEGVVLPHHGSLSRKLRLSAEQRLKAGDLRAVVATASLELGIDIGFVDLVCQIGSPRSIAVALQRIGRSGHWVGAMPEGRLFATTRDELIECAALVRSIGAGELDRLEIPEAPLDILAQQMVAAVACEEFGEDELFNLARATYPYRNLPRADFDAVLEMLTEGIASSRGHSGAYLHRDQVNHRLRPRRGARLAAITSGGAIPDSAQYLVVAEPEGATVGSLDEDFAIESLAGDVFLLGTTSWRIRRIEPGRVRVEDAHGAAPTIPFWTGEAPGRTAELSEEISRVRQEISHRVDESAPDPNEAAVSLLTSECGLNRLGAEQAVEYVRAGEKALGALPGSETVVAERFFDESGGMQLVIHSPFGARINRAWGLALRKRFCRSFNLELQAAATDNGIVISLSEQHAFPLEGVFEFLTPQTLEHVLTQALLDSPMFTVRWRWNLSRALAVLHFSFGRKTPPPIQRMRAEDMLAAVFPDQAACAENLDGEIRIPDHPLVKETIENCLYEAMDLAGLRNLIEGIGKGRVRTVAIDTAEPSPFCHEILNANPYAFLDDAPLEERRTRAIQMRRTLSADMVEGPGALDAEAIAQVADEAWPLVRDADELHDALLTLIALPPTPEWEEYFAELRQSGRATTLQVPEECGVKQQNRTRKGAVELTDAPRGALDPTDDLDPMGDPSDPAATSSWAAAERLTLAAAAYPEAILNPHIPAVPPSRPIPDSREACVAEILRGWLDSCGPATADDFAQRLALPRPLVEAGLLRLEAEGQILRGRFSPGLADNETEWCNRRLLARIHRLTLGRLRREIEPVSSADFMRFLCRWQHVASGTRLFGVDGALQIVKQLQGYEISAAAWESQILPRRVADYKPELLDQLSLSGEVTWGRLSPHPAFDRNGGTGESRNADISRRIRPTRVAPLALFLRENAGWLLARSAKTSDSDPRSRLSHPAREVLAALESRGASFFTDLVRRAKRLPSEVEEGLWELVTAGLVTADGFENLRALIDPKRRRGEGRGRHARPRHAPGRWALLREALRLEDAAESAAPCDTEAPNAAASTTSQPGHDPVESFAKCLLDRWGVLFRDLLRHETLAPPWRDLLVVLRRLEARGEIRGGRFVEAFVGEQFALPEAVELLRSVRRSQPDGEEIEIAASDPLNLVGTILPGSRVSSAAAETVLLKDGVVVEPAESAILALAGAGMPEPATVDSAD